jgi:hypothetical protein
MDKKKVIEKKLDQDTLSEMEKRVANFLGALKNPTKRLTPDTEREHVVHMVDNEGFIPSAKIHVEDEDEV